LFVAAPAVDPDAAFNTDRAYQRLVRMLGDETPHPVDSDANDVVRARLLDEITGLGFEPIVRDDFHCNTGFGFACARVQNVLFWVTEPGPDAVVLLSHYDSVPAGPGASDDGSGVAASLEIAHVLSQRALDRPLLVLITDGEETGLIGASSFVETDPLASQVGAVVNMEARGSSGIATLIQTSRPNSGDLAVMNGAARTAIASSLNADIYELMPNDTDMTMFLPLDIDAANFAYAGTPAHYHTPYDNLANLDRRALHHIGSSALLAAETFLGQDSSAPESQLMYTDILGLFVLALPLGWGIIMMGLGALAALFVFIRSGGDAPIRAALTPPLALIVGLGLAIGLTMLVGMIRPEASFGGANPWALRGLQTVAALLGAMFVLGFSLREGAAHRLIASAWIWFAAAGFVAINFAPGAAILFAPPLAIMIVVAVLTALDKAPVARWVGGFAAFVFAVIALPLTAVGETGLFIENAAPFAFAPLFIALFVVPYLSTLETGDTGGRWEPAALMGSGLISFVVCSIFVPAYSLDAPRSLSVLHYAGAASGEALWSLRTREEPPAAMAAIANFEHGTAEGITGTSFLAPAPDLDLPDITITTVLDVTGGDTRLVTLLIDAPGVDRFMIPVRNTPALRAVTLGGQATDMRGFTNIFCYGRTCRNIVLVLSLDTGQPVPDLSLLAITLGLGEESATLKAARPDWAVQQHWGDMRIVRVELPLGAVE
ncbi:MAG: M28 family peptidase, partial [Gammaproteobacteria bacterium]|nr:M28 family peptidase [Gammaproteobacteria bacterium]